MPCLTCRCAVIAFIIALQPLAVLSAEPAASTAELYRVQVDRRLEPPAAEMRMYSRLAEAALAKAGIVLSQPQHIVVVDRHPYVQALFLFWRSGQGEWVGVGASPVSTGMRGGVDDFETPLGVFRHTAANTDFRSDGTPDKDGIRRYGAKGMRVFDFGLQRVPKGWGDGAVIGMRLRLHATDPDALEQRLGSAQSKGCIRVPSSLDRLLDDLGVLDAGHERAVLEGRGPPALSEDRKPPADAGRYLIVVESSRDDRPEWSPAPFLPHRKPAAKD